MSFSKAKLKRFNDIDVACGSPAKHLADAAAANCGTPTAGGNAATTATTTSSAASVATSAAASTTGTTTAATTTTTNTGHPERKEQIEKFFKDAVRFASSTKEAKEFAIPKDGKDAKDPKEEKDKKSKGLRLFRTPSLPHRLRFRQNSDVTAAAVANSNNNNAAAAAASSSSTASSTPLNSAASTPIKEAAGGKSASRLKGKEALQHELRHKNELLENYMSQLDVLRRHVEQLKETETKLRGEHASMSSKTDTLIHELTAENLTHKQHNEQLSTLNVQLTERSATLESELQQVVAQHTKDLETVQQQSAELRRHNEQLEQTTTEQSAEQQRMRSKIEALDAELTEARAQSESQTQQRNEQLQELRQNNTELQQQLEQLRKQIEEDALGYAQETKSTHNELECLKTERNTLKQDLASKCDLIRALQDELRDKNCEIDAHCDNIRQLCRDKSKYVERERLMETAEEQVRDAEHKVQQCESQRETALEREKAYWRAELDRRQKQAENELIKIELEKQDVMVLLESTNDMLRERDERLQKYEDQLRNGIDYYVQLTDTLQKQVVDLKQDVAKTITEKYNYQLTLSNTRSTVNILMERLKKSDADVEQFKADIDAVQRAKSAVEESYLQLQQQFSTMKAELMESQSALQALHSTSETLQHEVSIKEQMFRDMLNSEQDTLAKFNKIASSFQERIDNDNAAHYQSMYMELKSKDDQRELYMQDMKRALDEFATVLQFAQIELDNKEKSLVKLREESEQLKLDNISLKSKLDESTAKRENSTDLEKIEDLLIDSELRAECDKITTWLLNGNEKSSLQRENANELNELLRPTTPNGKSRASACTTPVRSSATKVNQAVTTTPRSPRTPKSAHTPKSVHTPRNTTTPKKTVLFPGKENVPSPTKQVLKTRNM